MKALFATAGVAGLALSTSGANAQAGVATTVVATQLDSPVAMAAAPDGRVFIAQQGGAIRVVRDDVLLPLPFAVVTTTADDEEGLIGIALDPAFAANHFLYVCYTASQPVRHNHIARLTANGDVAAAGSEVAIFDMDASFANYHVGGAIHFGGDGKLYAATGDGDVPFFANNLGSTHGKVLRMNSNGTIPADNPFVATPGAQTAIYTRGFRNVFSFAVSPGSGRIFANDVGAASFEEVDDLVSGGAYGWPTVEGPGGSPPNINPIHSYPHSAGCAITGGAFYEPAAPLLPAQYVGKYFFADFCRSEIRYLNPAAPATSTLFMVSPSLGPVDFAVGADGSLYCLARGDTTPSGGTGLPTGELVKIHGAGATIATFVTYGDGCPGHAGIPFVSVSSAPHVGLPGFEFLVGNVPAGATAALHLGFSNTISPLGPLPVDLGFFGMPTCFLQTSGDGLALRTAGLDGIAHVPQPIPGNASLIGMRLHAQGFGIDPGANAAGVVASGGGTIRIGS